MNQMSLTASLNFFKAIKSTLFKTLCLSISILALSSASANAAQSCPKRYFGDMGTFTAKSVTLSSDQESNADSVICDYELPSPHTSILIKSPIISFVEGTGWNESSFDRDEVATCQLNDKDTCEFTTDENEQSIIYTPLLQAQNHYDAVKNMYEKEKENENAFKEAALDLEIASAQCGTFRLIEKVDYDCRIYR